MSSDIPQPRFSPSPPPVMGGGGWSQSVDPDWFLNMARELVVENYNDHHDAEETPELHLDDVYIIWFATVLQRWKAFLSSNVVKGIVWIVSYNEAKDEAYIEIYRRMGNVVKRKARNP